jgi:Mg-chelatase subunit ChlD
MIVHLERLEDGSRRVTSITEVQRMESEVITTQELFSFNVREISAERVVVGELQATGLRPTFMHKFEKRGVQLPAGLFREQQSRVVTELPGAQVDEATALPFVALLALVAATAASARPGERPPHRARGAHFPDRGYILSLPTPQTVTKDQVTVTENGREVTGLTIVPATALGSNEFALALVIDASQSMRGAPIAKAMRAARAFAAQRQPTQQLGALTFNAKSSLLLPFTTDEAAIDAALAKVPPTAYYTRTNDALIDTISAIESQQIDSASIVLLSDGRELGQRGDDGGGDRRGEEGERPHLHGRAAVALVRPVLAPAARERDRRLLHRGAHSRAALEHLHGARDAARQRVLPALPLTGGPARRLTSRRPSRASTSLRVSGYKTPALAGVASAPYKQPLGERLAMSKWLMILVAMLASILVAVSLLAGCRAPPHHAARSDRRLRLAGAVGASASSVRNGEPDRPARHPGP